MKRTEKKKKKKIRRIATCTDEYVCMFMRVQISVFYNMWFKSVVLVICVFLCVCVCFLLFFVFVFVFACLFKSASVLPLYFTHISYYYFDIKINVKSLLWKRLSIKDKRKEHSMLYTDGMLQKQTSFTFIYFRRITCHRVFYCLIIPTACKLQESSKLKRAF